MIDVSGDTITVPWRTADDKLVPHELTMAATMAGVTIHLTGGAVRCISCGYQLHGELRILGHRSAERYSPFEPLCRRCAAGLGLLVEVVR